MVNGQLIRIKCVVADYFQIDQSALDSPSRLKAIARARHIAFWLCRQVSNELGDSYSLHEIALAFGRRDHSTVWHSVGLVDRKLKAGDTDVARVCADLLASVRRVEDTARVRMMGDLVPRFSGRIQGNERAWNTCRPGPALVRCVVDIGPPVAIPMGDNCVASEMEERFG